MASKFLKLDVKPRRILWIVEFLVNRSQTVRHQAVLSSSRSISTGSPQDTVLSPILFTLYTNDCTGTDTTPIIILWQFCNGRSFQLRFCLFADVERFSNWCRDNSLDLNVKKTKEMLIDFRKAPTVIPDLFIDAIQVERATEYKDHRQQAEFNKNTDFIHKKMSAKNILPSKAKIS